MNNAFIGVFALLLSSDLHARDSNGTAGFFGVGQRSCQGITEPKQQKGVISV